MRARVESPQNHEQFSFMRFHKKKKNENFVFEDLFCLALYCIVLSAERSIVLYCLVLSCIVLSAERSIVL